MFRSKTNGQLTKVSRVARVTMTLTMVMVGFGIARAQSPTPMASDKSDAVERRAPQSSAAVATATQTRPAAPVRPSVQIPVPKQRRKASMVGYIDPAPLQTGVRIRFDSALHNEVPDRAEFFYAKCGCYRDLPSTHPAYDPESPGPRPGAADDLNFQQLLAKVEGQVTPRISLFVELPLRWIQPKHFVPGTGAGFPNQQGLGDIRGGVKLGLLDTSTQSATVQLQLFTPTGKADKGLGTDHLSVEAMVLHNSRVADRAQVEWQAGIWHPLDGAAGFPTADDTKQFAGDIVIYGVGVGVDAYQTPKVRIVPVVEVVGWHVVNGFESVATDASGTNILNLKIGARIFTDSQNSIYAGYGRGLTEAKWYRDIFRVEYRYAF